MRDRIKELLRVKASELVPNAQNWRKHPKRQRELLKNVLQTIGFADAALARETEDGKLALIDGHLRAEIAPNDEVPVLVVDLDEREADELLLLHDPIAAMAERDDSAVERLLEEFETSNETIRTFIDETFRLDADAERDALAELDPPPTDAKEIAIPNLFQILVECDDEDDQRECFEELSAKGRKCRFLNL